MKFKTILERTVAAWIGMCTLLLLIRPMDLPVTKDSFSGIPIWAFFLCIIAAFIIMTLFHHFTKFKHADTWLFAAAISLFLLLVAVRKILLHLLPVLFFSLLFCYTYSAKYQTITFQHLAKRQPQYWSSSFLPSSDVMLHGSDT